MFHPGDWPTSKGMTSSRTPRATQPPGGTAQSAQQKLQNSRELMTSYMAQRLCDRHSLEVLGLAKWTIFCQLLSLLARKNCQFDACRQPSHAICKEHTLSRAMKNVEGVPCYGRSRTVSLACSRTRLRRMLGVLLGGLRWAIWACLGSRYLLNSW